MAFVSKSTNSDYPRRKLYQHEQPSPDSSTTYANRKLYQQEVLAPVLPYQPYSSQSSTARKLDSPYYAEDSHQYPDMLSRQYPSSSGVYCTPRSAVRKLDLQSSSQYSSRSEWNGFHGDPLALVQPPELAKKLLERQNPQEIIAIPRQPHTTRKARQLDSNAVIGQERFRGNHAAESSWPIIRAVYKSGSGQWIYVSCYDGYR